MTDDAAEFAAQEAEAGAYLASKWTAPRVCPICSSNNWTVSAFGEIHHLQRTGSAVLGGAVNVFPVFFAACLVCGYMHLFNVVVAGIGPESVEQLQARLAAEAAQPEPRDADDADGGTA